jgi:hypothetical protein
MGQGVVEIGWPTVILECDDSSSFWYVSEPLRSKRDSRWRVTGAQKDEEKKVASRQRRVAMNRRTPKGPQLTRAVV